jgi:hypothetical protein
MPTRESPTDKITALQVKLKAARSEAKTDRLTHQLADEPALLADMGRRAVQRSLQFNREVFAGHLEGIVDRLSKPGESALLAKHI